MGAPDRRAFLAFWLCFKHDAHPALGTSLSGAVQLKLEPQLPISKIQRKEAERVERERAAAEQARLDEEAAEEWALTQVNGTTEALQMRTACESFGLLLWCAGADVPEPSAFAELDGRVEAFAASL